MADEIERLLERFQAACDEVTDAMFRDSEAIKKMSGSTSSEVMAEVNAAHAEFEQACRKRDDLREELLRGIVRLAGES
jgi:hypothetical protein